jgi:hypothetical protein
MHTYIHTYSCRIRIHSIYKHTYIHAGGYACGTAATENRVLDALMKEGAAMDALQVSLEGKPVDKDYLYVFKKLVLDERYFVCV